MSEGEELGPEARSLIEAYRASAPPDAERLEAIQRRLQAPDAAPVVSVPAPVRSRWWLGAGAVALAAAGLALWAPAGAWLGARIEGAERDEAAYAASPEPSRGLARKGQEAGAASSSGSPTGPDRPDADTPEPPPPPPESAPHRKAPRPPPPRTRSRDDLAAQMDLLSRARRSLQAGDAARALSLLREHERTFPKSQLGGERALLRVSALCRRDPERAREAARTFVARHPGSPFADRVDAACP